MAHNGILRAIVPTLIPFPCENRKQNANCGDPVTLTFAESHFHEIGFTVISQAKLQHENIARYS